MNRLSIIWLYFQYGWGKYGGWGVSALTLLFTFLTMMKVYINTPVLLDVFVILTTGVVYAAVMITIGRKSMEIGRGLVSIEHAMLTANNIAWWKYIDSYVALVNYVIRLGDCSGNNNEELRRAREELIKSMSELLSTWEGFRIS